MNWSQQIQNFDSRHDLFVPGDLETTLHFCVEHFFILAEDAIKAKDSFNVALSGGTTPKAIYKRLTDPVHRSRVDWKKVFLFWSDERNVPPYDPESNYRMAMEAAFSHLPIPSQNIHRMQAEGDIEDGAIAYENLIRATLNPPRFDLLMLGLGEDGHTASLFPQTHGLRSQDHLVIANHVPDKNTWRMTLTFDCINAANHVVFYVLGKGKAKILQRILTEPFQPDNLPAQNVGTPSNKSLIIADVEATSLL